MGLTPILWYAAGAVLLLLLLPWLARPAAVGLRLVGNSLLGGLALWAVNLLAEPLGFHLGINPISAFIVGILGLPGLAGLSLLNLVLA